MAHQGFREARSDEGYTGRINWNSNPRPRREEEALVRAGERPGMDARCRIELLGGLRVRQGEREITRFRAHKYGALLAYLAYHLRQQHPREALIEMLWPEGEPEAQRHNLSQALSS